MRDPSRQKTTAWRGYGDETEISKWLRANGELPSRSEGSSFTVNNNDMTIHAYKQCVDGEGTREVQSILRIEWKSYGKTPDTWQLDTLFKEHCGINQSSRGYRVKGSMVVNYGIYVCVCSGINPDKSDWIKWGRFNITDGVPTWKEITIKQLNRILRFDVHPKTLDALSMRRHHKTRSIKRTTTTPLGFDIEEEIVVRS